MDELDDYKYVWRPTPPIVVAHQLIGHITTIPRGRPVKAASEIFPTAVPGRAQEWDERAQKCVRLLFLLKHDLSREDISLLAGDAGDNDANRRAVFSMNAKQYFFSHQSKSINSNPDAWLGRFVRGHVGLHDAKAHIHNCMLRGLVLSRTPQNENQAQKLTREKEAMRLKSLAEELKGNLIRSYNEEMQAVRDGETSPFRFHERSLGRLSREESTTARLTEVQRLEAIRDTLITWPISEWRDVEPDTCAEDGLPVVMKLYSEMHPDDRLLFWAEKTNIKILASFYNSVLMDFDISTTFMSDDGTATRFGIYAINRFASTCDDGYWMVYRSCHEKEALACTTMIDLRAESDTIVRTSANKMYANSRGYFEAYNASLVNEPLVSMEDIKVPFEMQMD